MTAPRLHILTASHSPLAVILRRGPSKHVASIGWNRDTHAFKMGQWLAGTIDAFMADLSPDGRHMVYFARRNDLECWTTVARAPYLRAIYVQKEIGPWGGGGAFTRNGELWLTTGEKPLGKKGTFDEVRRASDPGAFPYSYDGFTPHGTYIEKLKLRGWQNESGSGVEARFHRSLAGGQLSQRFMTGLNIRARYAVRTDGEWVEKPTWQWAEPWKHHLHYAAEGALWQVVAKDAGHKQGDKIRDFSDMRFEKIPAPYEGATL